VLHYLHGLQDNLCRTFGEELDGSFLREPWQRPAGEGKLQGGGITAVQEAGGVMERAGVALSDVGGTHLPPSATARNPHLAGRSFRAMGVSVVALFRSGHGARIRL
jgi:coproporphyrinogen III oxidase